MGFRAGLEGGPCGLAPDGPISAILTMIPMRGSARVSPRQAVTLVSRQGLEPWTP